MASETLVDYNSEFYCRLNSAAKLLTEKLQTTSLKKHQYWFKQYAIAR